MDESDPLPSARLDAEIQRVLSAQETLLPAAYYVRRFSVGLPIVQERLRRARELQVRRTLGRYEVIEELGRGAEAVVYRAHDPKLRRDVGLKVLPPQRALAPEAAHRLRREAAALAACTHPCLPAVYEVGEAEGGPYLAMELVEDAVTLAEQIELGHEAATPPLAHRGPLSARPFLLRYADLCDALRLVHERGFVHRDIKPGNILATPDGTLKLLDFGIAHDLHRTQLTATGTRFGTPMYMSPEQISGHSNRVDLRTDVYGLGVTLYEALTATPPFPGASLTDLPSLISTVDPIRPAVLGIPVGKDLEAVLFTAMAKDPRHRYASAADMAADLRAVADGRAISARSPPVLLRLARYLRRRRAIVFASCAPLLVVAAIVGALVWVVPGLEAARRRDQTRTQLERFAHEAARAQANGLHEHALMTWARVFSAAMYGESRDLRRSVRALLAMGAMRILEGNGEHALKIAGLAHDLATSDADRAGALLLTARAAWLENLVPDALDALRAAQPIAAALPEPERERMHLLRLAIQAYGPRITYPWPIDGRVHRLRLEDGAEGFLMCTNASVRVVRVSGSNLLSATEPLNEGVGIGDIVAPLDANNDGVDEIVHVTRAIGPAEQVRHRTERLRVLRCSHGRWETAYEGEVANADYAVASGLLNADDLPDLVMGASYPGAGVLIFLNQGGMQFEELRAERLGALNRLRQTGTCVRDVCIARGSPHDSRTWLLAAAEEPTLYALMACAFDRGSTAFPGEAIEIEIGHGWRIAQSGGPPGSDHEELLGIGWRRREETADRQHRFLAPGIYRVSWPSNAMEWELDPLWTSWKPSLSDPSNPVQPVILHSKDLTAAHSVLLGPHVLTSVDVSRHLEHETSYVLMVPTGCGQTGLAVPFLKTASPSYLASANVDGRPGDEVAVGSSDSLTIIGAGVVPNGPRRESGVSRMAKGTAALPSELAWASLLTTLDLPAAAAEVYQHILAGSDRGGWTAAAREGLFAALLELGRPDEARALCESWIAASGHDAFEKAHWQRKSAFVSELLGNYEEAYATYRLTASDPMSPLHVREEARCDAKALANWRDLEAVPLTLNATKSMPRVFALRGTPESAIEVNDGEGREATMWLGPRFEGQCFRLAFDLRIDEMQNSQSLTVGFLPEGKDTSADFGTSVQVSNTSGQPRQVSLPCDKGDEELRDVRRLHPRAGLPLGEWHHFEMTYDAGRGRIGLVVRSRATGACRHVLHVSRTDGPPSRELHLGLRTAVGADARELRCRIENLSLMARRHQ